MSGSPAGRSRVLILVLVVVLCVVPGGAVAAVSQPGGAAIAAPELGSPTPGSAAVWPAGSTSTAFGDVPADPTRTVAVGQSEATGPVLEGTVRDAETGATLANATVTIITDGGTDATSTGSEGTFAFTDPPGSGEYAVSVDKRGYESTTETRSVPADERTTLDVSLVGSGAIDVAVADAHFGDAIDAGTVEAIGSRGTYSGRHVDDGTYRIENVPAHDSYDLRVRAAGYVSEERSVSPSATESEANADPESVALRGDATLEITVEAEDGELIENASVSVERAGETAFDAPSTTDADGTLAVTVPGTGESYAVEASAPGFEPGVADTGAVEPGAATAVTVVLPAPIPVSDAVPVAASIALLSLAGVFLMRAYVSGS